MKSTLFHGGELEMQALAGEQLEAGRNGRIISSTVTPGARAFLEQQRVVALATVAKGGELWATVLIGEPGLASSADGGRVSLRASLPARRAADAVPGSPVGLLAIDLQTRRRLRINGTFAKGTEGRLALDVRESFPNCPKYIQRRVLREQVAPPSFTAFAEGVTLSPSTVAQLEGADTMFVASLHPERGADVSHRGGEPGFLRALDDHTLRVPDYPGNSMFTTLGNVIASSRVGLAVVDFEGGRVLHLTGDAQLRLDAPEDPRQPTGGTGRYWDFRVSRWYEAPLPAKVGWALVERSPFNP